MSLHTSEGSRGSRTESGFESLSGLEAQTSEHHCAFVSGRAGQPSLLGWNKLY